ncbi:MAG: hypothetical protein ACOC92_01795 [bacterium]
MTRKLGHRDIVALCILIAALGAALLDRSGSWRVAGFVLVLTAVSIAFGSYVRQFRKDDHRADGRNELDDPPPPNEGHMLSAARPESLSASVLEILEPAPAFGLGHGKEMEPTGSLAPKLAELWDPSFDVYVATGSWEKSWSYVGRVPDPIHFLDFLLGPDFEIDEKGLKVRVSKYVYLKNQRVAEDPAIENLHAAWRLLDRSQRSASRTRPNYRWHVSSAPVKAAVK